MNKELIKSSTNSELGSYHWYHTILSKIKHIGEYMKDNELSHHLRKEWGNDIFNLTNELIEGYPLINSHPNETTKVSTNEEAKEECVHSGEIGITCKGNTYCTECGKLLGKHSG